LLLVVLQLPRVLRLRLDRLGGELLDLSAREIGPGRARLALELDACCCSSSCCCCGTVVG
jgi:hypothetical protein